jgi:hypothetical protein
MASLTSTTMSFGCIVPRGLGGGCVMMNTHTHTHEGRIVWRHVNVDGRHDKVKAVIPIMKMGWGKTTTSEACATMRVEALLAGLRSRIST